MCDTMDGWYHEEFKKGRLLLRQVNNHIYIWCTQYVVYYFYFVLYFLDNNCRVMWAILTSWNPSSINFHIVIFSSENQLGQFWPTLNRTNQSCSNRHRNWQLKFFSLHTNINKNQRFILKFNVLLRFYKGYFHLLIMSSSGHDLKLGSVRM